MVAVSVLATLLAVAEVHHVYFNRQNLPDLGPFTGFEFPTIGHVYDASGRPLIELAREYREIARYEDIPPIVRDAILSAEDKRFFSHNGIDYFSLPRALGKVRVGMLAGRLVRGGRHDEVNGASLFPQGGSTITQQLVRGYFLRRVTAQENSHELRHTGLAAGLLSSVMGARSVNMLARKREEMRISLWLEQAMRERFGSKRRAKEEMLARYASFVYMGNGQYGFARAAEYYFGRRLTTFTAEDADKAALLAGIAKSPRDYAPSARDTGRVLRRRNQTLTLMRANGFLSPEATAHAKGRALEIVRPDMRLGLQAPAVVEHVLEEFKVPPRRPQCGRSAAGTDPGVRDSGRSRAAHRERRAGARSRAVRPATSKVPRTDPGLGRRAAEPRWKDSGRDGRPEGLQGPLGFV